MSGVADLSLDSGRTGSLDLDTVHALLGNPRRRLIIRVIDGADTPLTGRDLVETVASAEPDSDIREDRHSINTSVKQRHLPQLLDVGAIQRAVSARGYVAGPESVRLVAIMETLDRQLAAPRVERD